jgi:hypothetical protein
MHRIRPGTGARRGESQVEHFEVANNHLSSPYDGTWLVRLNQTASLIHEMHEA